MTFNNYMAVMNKYFNLELFPDDLLGALSAAASCGGDEDDAEDTLP